MEPSDIPAAVALSRDVSLLLAAALAAGAALAVRGAPSWLAMTDAPFAAAASAVRPLDATAMAEAAARQDQLTKPRGALGRLES